MNPSTEPGPTVPAHSAPYTLELRVRRRPRERKAGASASFPLAGHVGSSLGRWDEEDEGSLPTAEEEAGEDAERGAEINDDANRGGVGGRGTTAAAAAAATGGEIDDGDAKDKDDKDDMDGDDDNKNNNNNDDNDYDEDGGEPAWLTGSIQSFRFRTNIKKLRQDPTSSLIVIDVFGKDIQHGGKGANKRVKVGIAIVPVSTFAGWTWQTRGTFTAPVYACRTHPYRFGGDLPVGEIFGSFVVISPLRSPYNTLESVWRQYYNRPDGRARTLDIGHRGLGRSFKKVAGQRRALVKENTVGAEDLQRREEAC